MAAMTEDADSREPTTNAGCVKAPLLLALMKNWRAPQRQVMSSATPTGRATRK